METTWAATSLVGVAWSGSTANEKPRICGALHGAKQG